MENKRKEARRTVTVQVAADMLHASEDTVRRLVKADQIEAYRRGKRIILLYWDSVEAFIESEKSIGPYDHELRGDKAEARRREIRTRRAELEARQLGLLGDEA